MELYGPVSVALLCVMRHMRVLMSSLSVGPTCVSWHCVGLSSGQLPAGAAETRRVYSSINGSTEQIGQIGNESVAICKSQMSVTKLYARRPDSGGECVNKSTVTARA